MPPNSSQLPSDQPQQPASWQAAWPGMQPGALPGTQPGTQPGGVPGSALPGAGQPSGVLPNVAQELPMAGAAQAAPGAMPVSGLPPQGAPAQFQPMQSMPGLPGQGLPQQGAPAGPAGAAAAPPQTALTAGTSSAEIAGRAEHLVEQYAAQPYQLVEQMQQLKGDYLASQYHITVNSAGH